MKTKKVFFHALCLILILSAYFLICAEKWFMNVFSVGIEQILFTIKNPMKGSNIDFLHGIFFYISKKFALLIVATYIFFAVLSEFIFSKIDVALNISVGKNKVSIDFGKFIFRGVLILFSVFFLLVLLDIYNQLKVPAFIKSRIEKSKIYEEYYVEPIAEKITGKGKNLILIYLESMETTYASVADGGNQPYENYIPHLTKLASENINFSNTQKLGGSHAASGTGWTMGALFSTSSGIPFKFPFNGNALNMYDSVGKSVVTLGDILKEKGYSNEFLCGSDGNFAGRKQFFEQNGDYNVFDLFTAREKGYIPKDYYVWWGFEDSGLYRIAKDEIMSLAKEKNPFNFTMLTVDTHHVGGYFCGKCERKHSENLMDVLNCADIQLAEFIEWISCQEFFKDTVIIITGDHPRMDQFLVKDIPYYERTVYNCFINASAPESFEKTEREFAAFDMFPTILCAMGFKIEGNRLGLGTNLFSNVKTLSEEMGFKEFNSEISKHSDFYENHFY